MSLPCSRLHAVLIRLRRLEPAHARQSKCISSALAYSQISVFVTPLRSLLREASNQSSDSVVCFGTLRPLRSLREVCLRAVMSFLHADYAESAEFFIFFSVLRWRWRGRKLRYDERAQRRAGRGV